MLSSTRAMVDCSAKPCVRPQLSARVVSGRSLLLTCATERHPTSMLSHRSTSVSSGACTESRRVKAISVASGASTPYVRTKCPIPTSGA